MNLKGKYSFVDYDNTFIISTFNPILTIYFKFIQRHAINQDHTNVNHDNSSNYQN